MWATLGTVYKVTRTGDRTTFWREPVKQRSKEINFGPIPLIGGGPRTAWSYRHGERVNFNEWSKRYAISPLRTLLIRRISSKLFVKRGNFKCCPV